MSEIEVGKTFFILEIKGKNPQLTLHSTLKTALKRIRRYFEENVLTEDVKFLSVTMKGDKLEVEIVPWSTVALKLVQLEEE